MGIIKDMRVQLVSRLFSGNGPLLRSLVQKFHKSPLKYAAVTAYLAPISKCLDLEEPELNMKIITSMEHYSQLHELLHIAKVNGSELVRVGRDNDGGYIMTDDFGSDDKIAYSFGICKDVSWDKDMASRGYDVFMYDHTIDRLPEENPRFHWSKLGIADGQTNDDRLKTLDELIARNHHEDKHDMILKMDVEGAEWGFFEQVSSETLSRFTQIVMEFHGVNSPELKDRILAALRKINQTHQLVHIHGQNVGFYISVGGQTFCNQIEVSYVRRDKYSLDDNYDVDLPLDIDMPASSVRPEVCLGRWNRKLNVDDTLMSLQVIL